MPRDTDQIDWLSPRSTKWLFWRKVKGFLQPENRRSPQQVQPVDTACVCDRAVTEFNTFRRRFLCVFKKGNTSNAFLVRCSSYESRRMRCLSRSQWSCDCVFPLSGLHWWKRWDGPVSGGERERRQQGGQRGLDSFARCRVMRIHPDHKVRTKRCYCDTGMSVP